MKIDESLPKMLRLAQKFPAPRQFDFPNLLHKQFAESGLLDKITPGMRIAVGVGSRGISNLKQIAAAVIKVLKEADAKPFIIPAMGSHGGATSEGQEMVLAGYGITSSSMGVPIESSMEVLPIGRTADGTEVVLSRPAMAADGIVVINRVKPHTDFSGPLGSGIQKMLTIGFGKQAGAAIAHGKASRIGHEAVIRAFAGVILSKAPVLCAVAILEDQQHQTAEIKVLPAAKIVEEESGLLAKARSLMAKLPFDEIDLLIVDEIGKEISGAGMDTNVIGRSIVSYDTSLIPDHSLKPRIFRIFVRDLTAATKGNGIGIGLADFTTTRLVKGLNLAYTYMNAITSLGIMPAKIPIHYDSDREVLENAFRSLAPDLLGTPRIVRIKNTLTLGEMLISEGLAEQAKEHDGVTLTGTAQAMEFDAAGNLLPF
jgi:hypothetical protein